jgi:hypothetical protein
MARNQEFADFPQVLLKAMKWRFLPPVSGGAAMDGELCQDGHFVALTRHAIDTRAVIRAS